MTGEKTNFIVAGDQGSVVPESFGEEMSLDEFGIVHTENTDEDCTLSEFGDD